MPTFWPRHSPGPFSAERDRAGTPLATFQRIGPRALLRLQENRNVRPWLDRRQFLVTTGAAGLALAGQHAAFAQGRGETLLVVQELGPNSLDMQGVGSNQTVNGLAWNCYDRLMSYGVKALPDGTPSYDKEVLTPELAESWQIASDSMSCTFKLRKDATFHDGTPVTAEDVKWSFDRSVSVGGFPTFQMSAGSLEKREQFVAVDDHTFRVDFIRKDKLLMFNLAVVVPFIINSKLARKNATETDPWALAWLKLNEAGGGAYKVESWKAGSETILARFDNWKSGPLPKIRRIIARDVPSAGTRRAMLERGDADLSTGFPPKDFDQMIKEGKVKVSGVPIPNALWYLALNTSKPPFDNTKLRQAIAWAVPYEEIQSPPSSAARNRCTAAPTKPQSRSGRSRSPTRRTSPRRKRSWRKQVSRAASKRRYRSTSAPRLSENRQ